MTSLVRILRDHGDAVEADLAFRGLDFRDLYRPSSGLTIRRVMVLIRALPPEAALWASLDAEHKRAKKPAAEQIRERTEHYRRARSPRRTNS